MQRSTRLCGVHLCSLLGPDSTEQKRVSLSHRIVVGDGEGLLPNTLAGTYICRLEQGLGPLLEQRGTDVDEDDGHW